MNWRGLGSGLLLLASTGICGLVAGGTVAGRLLPGAPGDMGWDRLADALGGMALGAVIGLTTGVYLVRRWPPRRRLAASGVLLLVAVVATVVLRATRPG